MANAPVFTGLHFWVRDMAATLAFYRLAGLPVPDDVEGEFVNFEIGDGVSLAFGTQALTRSYDPHFTPGGGKGGMAIQLYLDTRGAIDEVHRRLVSAGYRSHLEPFDAYWRARYCEVQDPDGNVVGFQSPRSDGAADGETA